MLHYVLDSRLFLHPQHVDCIWNVMAHAQEPDFVFRPNGWVHLNRQGLQFSRLLATEVCASAVVMVDTSSSEVVWRVLATHSIRQFPLHSPPCVTVCHDISTGLYLAFKCLSQLWKPFLQHIGPSYGVYTPYTSGCHRNHGVRACTSQRTHNLVTVVTMAIRAWLTESLTQGY
jgi:hypothetical protein